MGDKGRALHLSGPAEELTGIHADDGLNYQVGNIEYGITLHAELEEGGEVPRRAETRVNGPEEIGMQNLKLLAGGGGREGSAPSLDETGYLPPQGGRHSQDKRGLQFRNAGQAQSMIYRSHLY